MLSQKPLHNTLYPNFIYTYSMIIRKISYYNANYTKTEPRLHAFLSVKEKYDVILLPILFRITNFYTQ